MSITTALTRHDHAFSDDQRAVLPTRRPHTLGSSSLTSEPEIAALGEAVAENGIRPHQRAVVELARAAASLAPVAASVLASASEPEVARLRALARVSAVLVKNHRGDSAPEYAMSA